MGPYTLKSISKSGLCSLVNKNGLLLKKKYNASLLKPYFSNDDVSPDSQHSSDSTDPDTNDDVTSISQNDSSQEQSQRNPFDQLPDEIVQMILMKSTTLDNYAFVSNTCQRFKNLLEDKVEDILPMVHINFDEKLYNALPRRSNRIKVTVRKLSKALGKSSGIIDSISNSIAQKNWRSAWLLMEKRNRNWFVILRVFWKGITNTSAATNDDDAEEVFWLRNELYFLKEADRLILLSKNEWLTDNIMDAAQKLICKKLGTIDSYQSVLNSEKQTENPFQPVSQEHVQLLHDGSNHWFLTICSNGRVQVCDSLRSKLTPASRKSIRSLYKHYVLGGQRITFLPVQRQPDGFSCGLFAIAFAAELLDGHSPSESSQFDVDKMRSHLIVCLEQQNLSPFPKVLSD